MSIQQAAQTHESIGVLKKKISLKKIQEPRTTTGINRCILMPKKNTFVYVCERRGGRWEGGSMGGCVVCGFMWGVYRGVGAWHPRQRVYQGLDVRRRAQKPKATFRSPSPTPHKRYSKSHLMAFSKNKKRRPGVWFSKVLVRCSVGSTPVC